jgi:hypothetical protein
MSVTDITGVAVLFLAYGLTLLLFFRSLRIIGLIDKEDLRHMRQIRDRLEAGKSTTPRAGDGE